MGKTAFARKEMQKIHICYMSDQFVVKKSNKKVILKYIKVFVTHSINVR